VGGEDGEPEEAPESAGAQPAEDGAGAHLPRLPEVAHLADNAAVLPHILQQVCPYTDFKRLQLRHLQIWLLFSRFKASFSSRVDSEHSQEPQLYRMHHD